jgi:hypothetical protein
MASILEKLSFNGLPDHVSPDEKQLFENDHLISCIFVRPAHVPYRRMVVCYDRLYLKTARSLCRTSVGRTLAGLPHRPAGFDEQDLSKIVLHPDAGEMTVANRGVPKANEMEVFMAWDASRPTSPIVDVAAFPVTYQAAKDKRLKEVFALVKGKEGKWETLSRVGAVLDATQCAKFLLSDRHAAHEWVDTWLSGRSLTLPTSLSSEVKFFKELTMHELPHCCLKFDFRIVKIRGETFHNVPGPDHRQKNLCEQLDSALGTLMYGNKWTDFSASLELGLFPLAFVRPDGMSSFTAAMKLSPLHFVTDPLAEKITIPWALEGAFIFSLMGALVNGPLLHGNISRQARLQLAMEGFYA